MRTGIPMIRADGLTKRYPFGRDEKVVLHDVNLAIPVGQLQIISGPSGSGKTTLLALLAGMLAPTSGEVYLAGQCITHLRDHHRASVRRKLVGVVFQEFALVPRMSLGENLFLPWVPVGGPGNAERERARILLKRFGLSEYLDTPIERLSAGERQRGAILRALMADVPILLLDEPTAALDTGNVRTLLELLLELRAEGRTILVTTHDQRLVADSRVDKVLRLVDGFLEA